MSPRAQVQRQPPLIQSVPTVRLPTPAPPLPPRVPSLDTRFPRPVHLQGITPSVQMNQRFPPTLSVPESTKVTQQLPLMPSSAMSEPNGSRKEPKVVGGEASIVRGEHDINPMQQSQIEQNTPQVPLSQRLPHNEQNLPQGQPSQQLSQFQSNTVSHSASSYHHTTPHTPIVTNTQNPWTFSSEQNSPQVPNTPMIAVSKQNSEFVSPDILSTYYVDTGK